MTGTTQTPTASSDLSTFVLLEKQPHSQLDHVLTIRAISQLIFNSSYFCTQNLTPLEAERTRRSTEPLLLKCLRSQVTLLKLAYGQPYAIFDSSPNEQQSHQLKKNCIFFFFTEEGKKIASDAASHRVPQKGVLMLSSQQKRGIPVSSQNHCPCTGTGSLPVQTAQGKLTQVHEDRLPQHV